MCVLGVDQGVVSCVSLLYTLEWGMGVMYLYVILLIPSRLSVHSQARCQSCHSVKAVTQTLHGGRRAGAIAYTYTVGDTLLGRVRVRARLAPPPSTSDPHADIFR